MENRFFLAKEQLVKKLGILAFVLVFGTAFASPANAVEDSGLAVGVEFAADNMTEANEEIGMPFLTSFVSFEKSFFDDTVDFYARLAYNAGFVRVPSGGSANPHWLYFNIQAGYNLFLTESSTLSFLLDKELDHWMLSPRPGDSNNIEGILTPGIRFNHEVGNLGDFFAQIDFPIVYIQRATGEDAEAGIDFIIGWISPFGFEAELAQRNVFGSDFYAGFDLSLSYEFSPEALSNFAFYFEFEISGMGEGDSHAQFTPTVGIRFTF